jgi:hypothetical protein
MFTRDEPLMEVGMNRRIQLACALAGPALVLLFGLGLLVFAQMIPANSPTQSSADTVAFYAEHTTGIRLGMTMVMFGSGLFIPFGIALATQTRRAAPGHPILFHIQVACSVGACMLGVLVCLAGGLAAFRPGQIAPDITQTLNDLVWFCWVIPGSYFEVWSLVVGVAILLDKQQRPVFPRWTGYLSIWAAVTYLPGFLGYFFKDGVLAYNGLFVWWIPTVVFFIWILPMSILTIQAIRRQPETDAPQLGAITDPAVVAEFARLRAELAAHESTKVRAAMPS